MKHFRLITVLASNLWIKIFARYLPYPLRDMQKSVQPTFYNHRLESYLVDARKEAVRLPNKQLATHSLVV